VHGNSYKVDVYAETTVFTDLAHAFSHQLKNKLSKISKFDHIAKTRVIITRMNNTNITYIINAIAKIDILFIQITILS